MSVLFVACRGLKKLEGVSYRDVWELGRSDVIGVPDDPEYSRITEGLELGGVYEYVEDEWFTFGRRHEFSEGLKKLADFANYDARRPGVTDTGPFCEIFTNTESILFGTIVSAKLAADFAKWDLLAQARGWLDESFYDLYKHWWQMFKFAAKDGAVRLQCM